MRLVYLNIDGVNALPVDEFVFILMWRLNANLGSVYAAKNIWETVLSVKKKKSPWSSVLRAAPAVSRCTELGGVTRQSHE